MSAKQSPADTLCGWLEEKSLTQSEIAEALGVTRAAVCKWCNGLSYPSPENALVLEHISFGAVPASVWPARSSKVAKTPAAVALHNKSAAMGLSISQLAQRAGKSPRSLTRWAAGDYTPRASSIKALNEKLGLQLTANDFAVRA